MLLTAPTSLELAEAEMAVPDLAAISQSSLTMTSLGELRYAKVPGEELSRWLRASYEMELAADFKTPRITGFDDDGLGPHVTRLEFLVVRDLDLEPVDRTQMTNSDGSNTQGGRIVAYAEFKYHPMKDAQSESNTQVNAAAEWKDPELPPAVYRELHEHWNATVENALLKQFGGMHCFEVRGLSTLSPSHLRRGIASELLTWIFPWAERLDIPIVLAATPPGYPLYLKHGFVPVGANNGAIECNMADWGGAGVHRHVLMTKWPKK